MTDNQKSFAFAYIDLTQRAAGGVGDIAQCNLCSAQDPPVGCFFGKLYIDLDFADSVQKEEKRDFKTRKRLDLFSGKRDGPGRLQTSGDNSGIAAVGKSEYFVGLLIDGKRDQIAGDGEANANRRSDRPAREPALLRIDEIDPDMGHQLILQEIANPKGDIGIDVLGRLPERELPQIEAPTIARIKSGGNNIDFSLIDRYASANALEQMRSVYEARRGAWPCIPQTAMLRYFLRVSPDYGMKEVSVALTERKTTGCFRDQLSGLQEFIRIPQMEQLAINNLNDASPPVARDAARVLQSYGSPKAEAALWTRLERFHRKWKDQPDELLHPNPGTIVYDEDSGLEEALVQGISNGQAWFANRDTINRLKLLSSPAMQSTLNNILDSFDRGEFDGSLNWLPDGELHFALGWYSGTGVAGLKEKLAQFPAGSRFGMSTPKGDQETHRTDLAELADAAAASGLLLSIR